jgi:hypothetical protein
MKLIEVDTAYVLDLDDTLLRTTEKIKPLPIVDGDDQVRDLSAIENDDDNLYPDAERFIERAEAADKLTLAYSYSERPKYQVDKFYSLLKRPEMLLWVTDRKDKVRELGEHYNSETLRYNIGGYAVRCVVLIDDKKWSFAGVSEQPNITAIWVDRGLLDQPEELEPSVRTVFSLDEIDLSA